MSESQKQQTQSEIAQRLLAEVRHVASKMQPGLASIDRATLDSSLDRDLGFDSLGRVELVAHLERTFELRLPEQAFAEAETPRGLLRACLTAQHVDPKDIEQVELQVSDIAETPEQAETLLDMLDWQVQHQPEYTHIRLYHDEGDDELITYADLKQTAQRAAAGLQNRGLMPGDTVALMLPTCKDYFYSFFAILYAGGIPVPIYPPARPAQLEDHMQRQAGILANAQCRFLITIDRAKGLANMLRGQVESLDDVVTLDNLLKPTGAYTRPVVTADQIAFIQYTSGSTGNP
jgi:acyl carrier protein